MNQSVEGLKKILKGLGKYIVICFSCMDVAILLHGHVLTLCLAKRFDALFMKCLYRKENNNISVQNVGDDVQDRDIPKPVTAFDEAFKNYRE